MEHVDRLTKNLAAMILCTIGISICLAFTFGLFLSHYLGISYGLELMGLDTLPLSKELFIGPIMQFLLPDANYTNLLAIEVAGMLMIGTFVCFHLISVILHLAFERQEYVRNNDLESARIASRWMLVNTVMLILFLIPSVALFLWDLNLFQYRIIAGASGADTAEAATGIGNLAHQTKINGDMWVISSLNIGARGYLAMILIAAFGLEYSMGKMGENWTKLCHNLKDLIGVPAGNEVQPQFYGYDAEGSPVYDPEKPIAYDVNQNPVSGSQANLAGGTAAKPDEPLFTAEQTTTGSFDAAQTASAGCNDAETATSDMQDVIGGQPGEKITLDAALANSDRYWVDPDTREIWNADYRKNLFHES